MRTCLLLIASLIFSSCANHKGAIKPNWGLADFDKYKEPYYLSTEQVRIGSSKEGVIREFGDNYESRINGEGREIWVFKSYQATFATDPVQKLVTVEFINSIVSDVTERYLRGPDSLRPSHSGPEERLRKLKALHDDGIISDSDYEAKKAELLGEL